MKNLLITATAFALCSLFHAHAEGDAVLDTKLEAAIEAGDIKTVTAMIDADPALVKKIGFSGVTALHLAQEQTEIAKLLIERGADVNAPSLFSGPPLHRAIKAGNVELASYLLENGADIDGKDADGITVMHCLAWVKIQAKAERLYKLIEAKKPGMLESPGEFGYTPLWMCVDRINMPVTMLLLYQGANANIAPEGPGSSAADLLKKRIAEEPELKQELQALGTVLLKQ